MSLSHFFQYNTNMANCNKLVGHAWEILSFTWYHRWLQPVSTMGQDAQKPARKFCAQKTAEKNKTHPEKPEKGETGCVPGAGEGCSRYGRVGKPEIRTKMHQIAMQHMKKGNRRKPSVFAGFVAGAEGLEPSARGFGVDVRAAHRERRRSEVAPFSQPSPEKAVLVWCCEKTEAKTGRKTSLGHLKNYGRLNKERTKLSR